MYVDSRVSSTMCNAVFVYIRLKQIFQKGKTALSLEHYNGNGVTRIVITSIIFVGLCGAYALLPSAVAPLFRVVMEEPEFKNKFKQLVFAILERPRRPQGLDGHFAPFYHEFGTYTIE